MLPHSGGAVFSTFLPSVRYVFGAICIKGKNIMRRGKLHAERGKQTSRGRLSKHQLAKWAAGQAVAMLWLLVLLPQGWAEDGLDLTLITADIENQLLVSAKAMPDEQFERLVFEGQTVKAAIVNASALARVIAATRNAKTNQQWLPDKIVLQECVISGHFLLEHECPIPLRTTSCIFQSDVHLQAGLRGGWTCERNTFCKNVYFNLPQEGTLTPEGTSLLKGQPISGSPVRIAGSRFKGELHVHLDLQTGFAMGGCMVDGFAHFAFTGEGDIQLERMTFADDVYLRADVSGSLRIGKGYFQGLTRIQGQFHEGGSLEIEGTTFSKPAEFPQIHLQPSHRLRLAECLFEGDALFNDIQGGSIELVRTVIEGRTYVAESRVQRFEAKVDAHFSAVGTACIFGGRADFSGLQAEALDFTQAEFRGHADLTEMQIGRANLCDVAFEEEADFHKTVFTGSVALDGTRFQDRLTLSWDRLVDENSRRWPWEEPQLKLEGARPRTLDTLERAYERSGDTKSKNEAFYHRKLLESPHDFERWFSGYGVRPWRVACWMVVLFACFTSIYTTQMPRTLDPAQRLLLAASFSAKTAWSFGYGPQHSRGALWQAVTTTQMIGFKVMALLFAKYIANTSPLLNELASKLLPL